MALKSPKTAPYINRIRRLAKTNHKPLSDINVQNYSKLHAEGRITEALDVVKKASLRQLIKLNNYMTDLCKRQTDDVAVYNIRSGSIFVDEKSHANTDYAHTGWFMVFNELRRRLAGKLAGKTYFIPHYINYAMPVSEKQLIGSMPYGTLIHCPAKKAFTAAIAWENYKNERTDLDLHLTGEQSYGWNSGYRANDSAILYSGDMTDATNGAAEAFYFKPQSDDTYVLSVNNFTGYDGVPFKFFLTEKKFKACANSSTAPVDVKDALFAPIELTFKDSENMMLGVFADGDFLFYSGTTSGRIPNTYMKSGRKAMYNKTRNVLSVRQFLELAGAKVVDETEVSEDCPAISLAPACLTPQTFFEILEETT